MPTALQIPASFDFQDIRDSLQGFMEQQSEFTDYNFEGSGLSVLLDLLAKSTHDNALIANMFGSEMFLDSAFKRDSLVSHAKALNYQPRSKIAPTGKVDIVWVPGDTPTSITVDRGTAFTGVKNNVTYNFYVLDPVTVNPTGAGVYSAAGVEIKEGKYLTNTFIADSTDGEQTFTLPNSNVDTTSISVTVQASASDATTVAFNKTTDFVEITDVDKVYWIQEVSGLRHELIFGDGIVGFPLADGNIITVTYITTNGTDANDIGVFAATGTIGGYNSPEVSFTVAQAAIDGQELETNESIRKLAPILYQVQGRAVTPGDYKALLLQERPDIKSISIWGGEEADPPEYGKVFISVKPLNTDTWSDATKENIKSDFLKKLNMVSIRPEFIDPSIVYVKIETTVNYSTELLQTSGSELQDDIETTITSHFTTNLGIFNSKLRHSALTAEIDNTDSAILNNLTSFSFQKRFVPTIAIAGLYNIHFANPITAGSVSSTSFTIDGVDYSLDDDSVGNIRTFRISGGLTTYLNETAGTIDYSTGEIILNEFIVNAFTGDEVKVDAVPSTNNISPLRENIVQLDDSATNIIITLVAESSASN